jgi:Integrase zinc binding domain/Integrase core domain
VPPIPMREQLVIDYHASHGHCGVTKTIDVLRQVHWWPSMRAQVASVVARCSHCQRDKLPKPVTMAPNASVKPDGPFKVWSIDLAGPFPPDQDGCCYAIVAVDVFSKWVEIGKLPSKHAWRTAEWVFSEIVCRWGKPSAIRMDNGSEWKGEFEALLKDGLGITFSWISIGNSRANG